MAVLPPTRVPPVRNEASKIQLERLTHVYLYYKDLDKFAQFARDFGFVEAYSDKDTLVYRGYGKDPFLYVALRSPDGRETFGGGAWVAQTEADFTKAAALKGAKLSDLAPFPGGGRRVTLTTPAGFLFHVVYGQEERTADTVPSAQIVDVGPYNGTLDKRRLGKFQRFHHGPAMVHKLGHYGCIVGDWDREIRWYTDNFNFVPTDVQHSPKNADVDVVAFVHLDLGERFTDHHSLFLARARPDERDSMHHTSFEVEDFDTQLIGHEWLARKGYKSVWGVGRHILGSQIFDYWEDTGGFTIEHYADGDLVNVHTPTDRMPAGPLAIWGPEFPPGVTLD